MTRQTIFRLVISFVIVGFFSSCSANFLSPNSATLIPAEHIPTVIALTSRALVSQSVSQTPDTLHGLDEPTPLADLDTPSEPILTPTIQTAEPDEESFNPPQTQTPFPTFDIPYANIQFLNPGTLSRITSPIKLHAFLLPGETGRARVELYGEDGRLMFRKLFIFGSPLNIQKNLKVDINFEIKGVAETATLVISVDDWYGRFKTLASQDIILLSFGDSDINPSGDHLAPIVVQEPLPKVLIQGDTLVVSGLVRTVSELPLLVELITTDGKVIGSRLAGLASGREGDYRVFATEVNYEVFSPTWVRVTISEWNKWQSGPAQLTSVEVLLSPE